jgi:hypothetical protein
LLIPSTSIIAVEAALLVMTLLAGEQGVIVPAVASVSQLARPAARGGAIEGIA